MDVYAVFGELLYIISNYEKGRINTRGFWKKKYIDSLNESLNCMSTIVQLMKSPSNIEQPMLLSIIHFCDRNICIIFPKANLKQLDYITMEFRSNFPHDEYADIINLMDRMITECIALLKRKNHGYKNRLSCLLKAFHNLPKVFLDSSKQTLFNINTNSICLKDANAYSSSYIDLYSIT